MGGLDGGLNGLIKKKLDVKAGEDAPELDVFTPSSFVDGKAWIYSTCKIGYMVWFSKVVYGFVQGRVVKPCLIWLGFWTKEKEVSGTGDGEPSGGPSGSGGDTSSDTAGDATAPTKTPATDDVSSGDLDSKVKQSQTIKKKLPRTYGWLYGAIATSVLATILTVVLTVRLITGGKQTPHAGEL